MIARCFESIANIEFKDYNLAKNQYIYESEKISNQIGNWLRVEAKDHIKDMMFEFYKEVIL